MNYIGVWNLGELSKLEFKNSIKIVEVKNNGPFEWNVGAGSTNLYTPNYQKFNYGEILTKINKNIPILIRHYDSLPFLELDIRRIAFTVMKLASLFKENQIKALAFPTGIPHHLDSLICQVACEINCIAQVFFYPTIIDRRVLPTIIMHDITDRKIIKTNCSKYILPQNSEFILSRLQLDLGGKVVSNFCEAQLRMIYRSFKNLYFHCKQSIFDKRNKVEDLKRPNIFVKLGLMKSVSESNNFLKELCIETEEEVLILLNHATIKKQKILVLYAHFQPESTTFPEGNIFFNHIDLITTLRESGFDDLILYKEHPALNVLMHDEYDTRTGCSRRIDYYQQLKELNCKFATHAQLDEFKNVVLPITICGSIAIERSLKGLKTVVVGQPWFIGLPGTFTLEQFLDLNLLTLNLEKDSNVQSGAVEFLSNIFSYNSLTDILYLPNNFEESEKVMALAEYQIFFEKFTNQTF